MSEQETPREKYIRDLKAKIFGARYRDSCLSRLSAPPEVQRQIAEFLQSKKNFLVYCGGTGCGKTYLSSALFEWGMKEFPSFRYWKENTLLSRLRDSIGHEQGDFIEKLRYLIDDDLVMLDDIGSAGLTDWRKDIFFEAIDYRYCSMLPTIVISNYSKSEYEKIYHERVASRLFSKENIVIELFDGVDKRKT